MSEQTKIKKKILSVTGFVLASVVILFLLYSVICSARGKIAFIGGRAFIRIVTQSMEPTIPTGTYIEVEKLTEAETWELEVGDVIVFHSHDPRIYGKLNTHRIAEINENDNERIYVTKGDNNPVNDSTTVKAEDIVAIYRGNSSKITKVVGFFSGKTVFFLLVLLPAAALLVICVIDVAKKSREVKMDILVKEEIERLKKEDEQKNKDDK